MQNSKKFKYIFFSLLIFTVFFIASQTRTNGFMAFLGKPLAQPIIPTSSHNQPTLNPNVPRTINVLVLMDDNSYTVSDSEIQDTFNEANKFLLKMTNTKFKILKIWHVNVTNDQDQQIILNNLLASNKNLALKSNYIVYFSEHPDCSHTYGGCNGGMIYNMKDLGMNNYCNTYADPNNKNFGTYLTWIDWNHRFAACGYDDGNYGNNHLYDVSQSGGSCKNQAGIACIFSNKLNYYICENSQNDYLAQNSKMLRIHAILHELMHNFGTNVDGNIDHTVGSQACLDKFQSQNYQFNFQCPGNTDVSQCFFNICQYAWVNFIKSQNICTNRNDPVFTNGL